MKAGAPGRTRGGAYGDRSEMVMVRLTPEIKAQLAAASRRSNRSMSAEAALRLQLSLAEIADVDVEIERAVTVKRRPAET